MVFFAPFMLLVGPKMLPFITGTCIANTLSYLTVIGVDPPLLKQQVQVMISGNCSQKRDYKYSCIVTKFLQQVTSLIVYHERMDGCSRCKTCLDECRGRWLSVYGIVESFRIDSGFVLSLQLCTKLQALYCTYSNKYSACTFAFYNSQCI